MATIAILITRNGNVCQEKNTCWHLKLIYSGWVDMRVLVLVSACVAQRYGWQMETVAPRCLHENDRLPSSVAWETLRNLDSNTTCIKRWIGKGWKLMKATEYWPMNKSAEWRKRWNSLTFCTETKKLAWSYLKATSSIQQLMTAGATTLYSVSSGQSTSRRWSSLGATSG